MKTFWKPKTKSKSFFNESKYPSRSVSENKLISKHPYKDSDKDGVMNWYDCKPKMRKKQDVMMRPTPKPPIVTQPVPVAPPKVRPPQPAPSAPVTPPRVPTMPPQKTPLPVPKNPEPKYKAVPLPVTPETKYKVQPMPAQPFKGVPRGNLPGRQIPLAPKGTHWETITSSKGGVERKFRVLVDNTTGKFVPGYKK
jgi:hypothetical protein